jgi:hypothetical protein
LDQGIDWLAVAIGSIAGGICSLLITHVYFMKGKGLQHLMGFLTFNIEKAMLPNIYTSHFNSRPKIHLRFFENRPKNLGHPHLTEFILPSDEIIPGREYTALFRVSDHDMDFYMSEHAKAAMLGDALIIKDETFGFMSMPFKLSKSASQAIHKIEFEFIDAKGNRGTHIIELYPLKAHNKQLQRIAYGAR